MCGLLVGLTRMIMDFAYESPLCGATEYRPAVLYKVSDYYYSMFRIKRYGIAEVSNFSSQVF